MHVVGGLSLLTGIGAALVAVAVGAIWAAAHPARIRALLRWLAARPSLARLRSRHGQAIEFLVARLRPQGAYGLSFTAGFAGLGLAAIAFAGVLEDVIGREELALLDQPVTSFVGHARTPWLTTAMRVITLLGSTPVIAGVIVCAGTLLRIRTRRWRPLLLLAAVSAGAAALDTLVKIAVARPRPPAALALSPTAGYAFPSGHTVQAAVYGGLAFLLAREVRSWWAKVAVWAGAVVVALLLGLSRVYLGVHWLTDVLGGWALGTAWLAFTLTVATTIGRLRPGAALFGPGAPELGREHSGSVPHGPE